MSSGEITIIALQILIILLLVVVAASVASSNGRKSSEPPEITRLDEWPDCR